ncbi:MAG: glycosyltransferase [Acidimicrobiales bacterium]
MPADEPGAPLQVTVVLPAHNEEDILANTVAEIMAGLRARGAAFEVVIVENGSRDATLRVAQDLAALHPELVVLTSSTADYGEALRRGLQAARGDVVVNFDVDYYDLGFFDDAVAMVRAGKAGIVVGTKRGLGAQDDRPWPRRVVTGGFSWILRFGFGLQASDTHGMKALDRHRLAPLADRCQLGADLFDTELVLRAEREGIVVAELPVQVIELRPARSPIARRVIRTVVGLRRLHRALRNP